jgi:hypothetical protein
MSPITLLLAVNAQQYIVQEGKMIAKGKSSRIKSVNAWIPLLGKNVMDFRRPDSRSMTFSDILLPISQQALLAASMQQRRALLRRLKVDALLKE